jgi:hypothetical protein
VHGQKGRAIEWWVREFEAMVQCIVGGVEQVYEMVTEDARQRQQEDERERQAACVR